MSGTSKEHFKGEEVLDGKVVLVLKVFDVIIKNVDLLANSNNHKVMFPEHSRIRV